MNETSHSEEPKHKNQRSVSIGKDAEDNVIIAGDHVTVNIHKTETSPMPPPKEPEPELVFEKKPVSQNKKIMTIAGIVIAILIAGGIWLYLAMSEVPNISGVWKYYVPKDERIWIISQKGRGISIREDSGNECTGNVGKNNFSFSCSEAMTSGAEPVRFTGSGKINPTGNKIEGRWEREGLEGSFVMERQ